MSERQPRETTQPHFLGRLAHGLLAFTVLSGALLVPFYDALDPERSVEHIQSALPLGWLLRALHWHSAQLLLLVFVAHVAEVLVLGTERSLSKGRWWLVSLTGPLVLLAMLSGYFLPASQEAIGARTVFDSILDSIPLIGHAASRLLSGGPSLSTSIIHHAGTFTVLLWLLTSDHIDRVWPDYMSFTLATLGCVILAGFVPVGLDTATTAAPVADLLGPWYLLGLQGALLVLPKLFAWLWPLTILLGLGLVRHLAGKGRLAGAFVTGALFFGVHLAALLLWLR